MFLVVMLVDTVDWAIFPSSSAIVAELISHHVENMKLTLLHCLRDQKNKEHHSEIDSFLRFLELRPFKYSIWRVVPVDLGLPVSLIGLCTTYTIVIIQLTRLYG
ncbi:uncharacterized protein LOC125489759 [Plutella xylostella]|uniref:uncharacterized protein LOC125489759 n=1 Tax=Plutella xylostella TaxID=51655 RepID=UPI00203305A7|nr:uncharacterized protein LOC125489759 [Plutella xylostella]